MPEKAEPFGFRRGTITVQAPPIELNPEIVLPDIQLPEIRIPEIKIPPAEITVHADPPVIKVEPIIRVEAPVVHVAMPESKGWKFSIHKRKDGDIEMTARPL